MTMATSIRKRSDSEHESTPEESDDDSNLNEDIYEEDEVASLSGENTDSSENEEYTDEDVERDEPTDTDLQNELLENHLSCKALQTHKDKRKGYLSCKKDEILKIIEKIDQDWIKVENQNKEIGLVPLNYVTILKETHKTLENKVSDASTKSGKDLWSGLKKAIQQPSTTDVLSALGAMPSGFRPSTLRKFLNQGCQYTLECALSPKLKPSNLGFSDLQMDATNETLQVSNTKVQRSVRLLACKSIPLPGAGMTVLSRHTYICLFDGSKIISNIHRVSAKWDSTSSKLWSFASKSSLPIPCSDDANILVRSKNAYVNLGVLFEVCITVYRESSNELKELSCGWVFVKLFDAVGLPVNSGTYNLKLQGGTPSEHGVAVDASILESDSINPLKAIVTRMRQPKLVVKISKPETQIKSDTDFLPATFVGALTLLPFYNMYRQLLADALLRDRVSTLNAELVYSPVLSQFPNVASQPDVMDVLRASWAENLKSSKRSDKTKPEFLKRLFTTVFMDNVFVYTVIAMVPFSYTDIQAQQSRNDILNRVQNILKIKGPSGVFLSSQFTFKPFDSQKLSLDILGPHYQHVIDES